MRMTSLLPLGPNCITYGTLRVVRLGPVITLVPYYTIIQLIQTREKNENLFFTLGMGEAIIRYLTQAATEEKQSTITSFIGENT